MSVVVAAAALAFTATCRLPHETAVALAAAPLPLHHGALLNAVAPLKVYHDNWPSQPCAAVAARAAALRPVADRLDAECAMASQGFAVPRPARPADAPGPLIAAAGDGVPVTCPELAALCVGGGPAAPAALTKLCPGTQCQPEEYMTDRQLKTAAPARERPYPDDDWYHGNSARRRKLPAPAPTPPPSRYNATAQYLPACTDPRYGALEGAGPGLGGVVDCRQYKMTQTSSFGGRDKFNQHCFDPAFAGACPCTCRRFKTVELRNVTCATIKAMMAGGVAAANAKVLGPAGPGAGAPPPVREWVAPELALSHRLWSPRQHWVVPTAVAAHCPATLGLCAADTVNCSNPAVAAVCVASCKVDPRVCIGYGTDPRRAWLRRHTRPKIPLTATAPLWAVAAGWLYGNTL